MLNNNEISITKKDIPNPTDELFTSNRHVHDLCLLGESSGLSKESFANQIGLSLSSIEDPQVIIAKRYIVKAYKIILEFTDDELLGAGIKTLPRGSVDLMVKSASSEETLAQALNAIQQVIKISQSSIGSTIYYDEHYVHWRFSPSIEEGRFKLLINTLCTCMAYKLLSILITNEVDLEYASFDNDKPLNISDYQFLFTCPLKFNQAHCEIVFSKEWLKLPIRCNYQEVKHYFDVPLSITGYSHNDLGIVRQVKDIFASSPYACFPEQQELADQLGMSVRTMQRKLDIENTSYMQLKDDVRKRKALFYLEHTDKHINEIAERCGFSEVASFTRAFTRWTGSTPAKYKKQ